MKLPPLLLALASTLVGAELPLEIPRPSDGRFEVTLYAADPAIVTPIGAAVDARGRLFVLESHTHLAPRGYAGPRRDRIKVFAGAGPDGRAARVSVFADDVNEGMNLAFAPDGTLYVCAAQEVFALADRDGDGRADSRRSVLRLETQQTYPHSQLLGLTFSLDGWLYVSRGNVGGLSYAWVGADGTRLPGYGDGGDIVRCRPDGTELERIATGFWNPFDLKFDAAGRLLAADNDPDSRGPNRLVHVVPGGDYGYRALYGTTGLHAYQAWDGELPGTLPYAAALGESPSGLVDTAFAAFPRDFVHGILVTVWGEHTVTLHRLRPAGSSVRGDAQIFLRGGKHFRPVALAAAPDGAIFITDWVLSDYPNHGRGRIWKLVTRAGVPTAPPARPAAADPSPRLAALFAARPTDLPALRAALADADPFVRHAAVTALARPAFRDVALRDLAHADASVRLGALLALRRMAFAEPVPLLRSLLRDPDADVRQAALLWTGENLFTALEPEVDAALSLPGLTPQLFEIWLATVQILRSDAAQLQAARVPGARIKRTPSPELLASLVADERRPTLARTLALARLGAAAPHRPLLVGLVRSSDPVLQLRALARLAAEPDAEIIPVLRALALDRTQPAEARATALTGLEAVAADFLPLLDDPAPAVRIQAARTLRSAAADPRVRAAAARRLAASPDPVLASELAHLLDPARSGRPDTLAGWQQLLADGGDPAAGRRVFFSRGSLCSQCHRHDGRGGQVGPDLSVIGRTAGRAQLVQSIVNPSDDVAPQFQGWEIRRKSGEIHTGLQGHLRSGKGISLLGFDGAELLVPEAEVADFGAMTSSLMPAGLEKLLSPEEFRDLVAFLAASR